MLLLGMKLKIRGKNLDAKKTMSNATMMEETRTMSSKLQRLKVEISHTVEYFLTHWSLLFPIDWMTFKLWWVENFSQTKRILQMESSFFSKKNVCIEKNQTHKQWSKNTGFLYNIKMLFRRKTSMNVKSQRYLRVKKRQMISFMVTFT